MRNSTVEASWEPASWEESPMGARFRRVPLEDRADAPMVILVDFPPHSRVVAHTHDTSYAEYVIEGSQRVGKKEYGPGEIRVVAAGTGYGPIEVGPQGCKVLITFADGSRYTTIPLPRKKQAPPV